MEFNRKNLKLINLKIHDYWHKTTPGKWKKGTDAPTIYHPECKVI